MRSGLVIDRAPPPGSVEPGEGGGDGWAWLLTVRGVVEAQLVRGLLEQEGVSPVHLDATDPSPTSWMFLSGDVNALVRVYVLTVQLDAARLAMLDWSAGEPDPVPEAGPPRRGWRRSLFVAIATAIVVAFALRLALAACQVRGAC